MPKIVLMALLINNVLNFTMETTPMEVNFKDILLDEMAIILDNSTYQC